LERFEDAEFLVGLIFAWLRHLAFEESADVAAALPRDLRDLWERTQLPQVPPWQRLELRSGIAAQPVPHGEARRLFAGPPS
jgi:uncharacterized protein (DUF2267 family)